MEGVFNLVPLVILAPVGGLILNLLLGRRFGERGAAIIAVGAASIALVVAAVLMIGLWDSPGGKIVTVADWIDLNGVEIAWTLRVDTLSVTMMLVVAGVGTLIHIYAVGYMHGDERFRRFFVYMNLFLASMLTLVSGNNFLVLFVGWELVGLCSFLLIGFWLHKDNPDPETGETAGYKNTAAAKKAFIVNRVGDFGFILAIFLIFWAFGTLSFGPIAGAEHGGAHDAEGTHEEEAEPAGESHSSALALTAEEGDPAGDAYVTAEGICVAHPEDGVFGMAEAFMEADCDVQVGGHRVNIGTLITIVTLLMLLGVAGKSAQIPLFVWLPDAMAGPTPVSALIHAATMVTAGVYMVTRSNVLYEAARGVDVLPLGITSPGVVAFVGSLTAFIAGTIALAQWDIKRVLAYSTISQLGFMVAAVGLGGYVAGMFHLVTHAFFKALLFLAAGSVIHGVEHGEHTAHEHGGESDHGSGKVFGYREGVLDPQDMRNMGGIKDRMPVTFWVYTIGALALAGIFPFAGFWSKDEILVDALETGGVMGPLSLILLVVAAGFTAFYMGRQVFMIFLGEPRTVAAAHAHESPRMMTYPLVALASLSAVGGLLNLPGPHPFGKWLEKSVVHAHTADFNIFLAVFALAVAGAAIYVAYFFYYERPALEEDGTDPLQTALARVRAGGVWTFLHRKWYWDEVYANYVVAPFNGAADYLGRVLDWELWHDDFHNKVIRDNFNRATEYLGRFDLSFIDGIVNGLGDVVKGAAGVLRYLQTGYVRNYALGVLIGTIAVLIILLLQ